MSSNPTNPAAFAYSQQQSASMMAFDLDREFDQAFEKLMATQLQYSQPLPQPTKKAPTPSKQKSQPSVAGPSRLRDEPTRKPAPVSQPVSRKPSMTQGRSTSMEVAPSSSGAVKGKGKAKNVPFHLFDQLEGIQPSLKRLAARRGKVADPSPSLPKERPVSKPQRQSHADERDLAPSPGSSRFAREPPPSAPLRQPPASEWHGPHQLSPPQSFYHQAADEDDDDSPLHDGPPPPSWIPFTAPKQRLAPAPTPDHACRPPLEEQQAMRRDNRQPLQWLPQALLAAGDPDESSATESVHQTASASKRTKQNIVQVEHEEQEHQEDSFDGNVSGAGEPDVESPRAAGKRKAASKEMVTQQAQMEEVANDEAAPTEEPKRKRFKPRRSEEADVHPKRKARRPPKKSSQPTAQELRGPLTNTEEHEGYSVGLLLPETTVPRCPATYTMFVNQKLKHAWMRGSLVPPPLDDKIRLSQRAAHAATMWSRWTYTLSKSMQVSHPSPPSHLSLLQAQHASRHSNTWTFAPFNRTLYKRTLKPQLNLKMIWKFRVDGIKHKSKRTPLPKKRGRRLKMEMPYLKRNLRMYATFLGR